jgi:hypothetical protein
VPDTVSFMQIPRLDISAPANAIEYHPALLAHNEDSSSGGKGAAAKAAVKPEESESEGSETGEDDNSNLLDDDDSAADDFYDSLSDSEDSVPPGTQLTLEELAEHEKFGAEYTGPVLDDDEACRLLILMAHASTCPCR